MNKEEILQSYEANDIAGVISNYSYLSDEDTVISTNGVDLTLGDLKAELNRKNGGAVQPEVVEEPAQTEVVQEVQQPTQTKEDLLNSYSDEQIESIVNNYTYLNDDQIALSINNVDLTAGDLRAEQAKRAPQVEEVAEVQPTQTKEDLLNSYSDEQIESIVNNYTYLNDDQIALSINNVDLTAGDLRAEQAKRAPQVEEIVEAQQPTGLFQGDIGEGMPTPEEQFEQATGEKFDPNRHEIVYDGANNDLTDDSYTPFTVVEKEQPQIVDDNPQHEANLETGYAVGGFQAPAIAEEKQLPAVVEEQQIETPQVVEETPYMAQDVSTTTSKPDAAQVADAVMTLYNSAGYMKNAFGEFYNPNTDEYDESYDPHNDPMFNEEEQSQENTEVETNNHKLLFVKYAQTCNKMGQLLGIDPYPGIENESPFNMTYQLDENEVDLFNEYKTELGAINSQDSKVASEYFDLMTKIKSIRTEMGAILNKPPYAGIENENYHDISLQLDDNDKDRFAERKAEIDEIKKDHPELFENLQMVQTPVTKGEEAKEEQEQEGPQEATPEEIEEAEEKVQEEDELDDLDEDPELIHYTPTQEELLAQRDQRRKFAQKALAGAIGFVAGVGLSCVPGVGYIRMGLAAAKLVSAGVNFWAKRHPDGKIAQARNFLIDQWYEKCPNLARGVDYIRDKMKQVPYNAFINGMSAGYITGNVFELITGQTVFQAIGDKVNGPTPAITAKAGDAAQITDNSSATITENPIGDTSAVTEVTDPVITTPDPVVSTTPTPDQITEIVKSGQSVDISGIEMGRVSSDAQNAVKLLQSRGSDVTFLREVTLNDGTKMWAFNQANGAGYAWFKADDIIDYLGQNAPEIAQGVSR